MTIDFNWPAPQGWECPKCGTVYSPSWVSCNCSKLTRLEKLYTYPEFMREFFPNVPESEWHKNCTPDETISIGDNT